MAKEKEKAVFPGDFITTEEEFVAGRNAYEEDGEVKASIMGKTDFDQENKEVNVRGNGISTLKVGDIVIGQVIKVKESMVTVELLGSEKRRAIGMTRAQIPVRNISQAYVEDPRKLFKVGDYVKAKVTVATRLAIDLATNEKGLGVVEARCSNCKKKMDFNKGRMTCLACGNVEDRKWFEAEDERGERSDRGGFRDSGRRDSRGGGRRDSRGGRDRGRRDFSRDRRDSRGGRDRGRGGRNFRDSGRSRGGSRNEDRGNRPRQRRN